MASPTQPLDEADRNHQLLRIYQGLRELEAADKPSVEGWLMCPDVVNLNEALIELGVAEDSTGLLRQAAEAPGHVGLHVLDNGDACLEGEGLAAVRQIVYCCAGLLAQVPARTIIRAHRQSELRLREIRANKDKRSGEAAPAVVPESEA